MYCMTLFAFSNPSISTGLMEWDDKLAIQFVTDLAGARCPPPVFKYNKKYFFVSDIILFSD
jgi:hypothetical protein